MRYSLGLLLAATVFVSPTASAVVLEIPMPGLHGDVPADFPTGERQTTVSLPNIAAVNSVSLRVSGTQTSGELECDGQPPSPWPLDIGSTMVPLEGLAWVASTPMPTEDGAFSWTEEYSSIPAVGVSWDNFLDGEETITLNAAAAPIVGLCSTNFPPSGSVTEVVLILDYEQTVTTQSESWSAIKALYP